MTFNDNPISKSLPHSLTRLSPRHSRARGLLGAAALAGFVVGCSVGGGGSVCQQALDHLASCTGSSPVVFPGCCDGQMAESAREALSLSCELVGAPKADGDCPDLMARLGMCDGASATLGPWGLRITSIVATDSRCRHEGSDLLEPGLELRNAPTVEKCLETREFRPTIDVGDEETYWAAGVPDPTEEKLAILSPYGLENADDVLLANVGHVDGTFAIARIPDRAFDTARALYLIETFETSGIRGSHAMVRIRFDAPVVELYRQYPPSSAPIGVTQEIVLSVHAIAVRGGSYDPLGTGIHDGMALARGVYSIEHKVQDVLLERMHTVEQYKLRMTGDDIRRYVATYTADAPERLFTTSYHTFWRNCGTEVLQVFKDAFPERNYPAPESLDNTPFLELLADAISGRLLPDIIPEKVRPALESRGLFDGVAEPWATDPTIQEVVWALGG